MAGDAPRAFRIEKLRIEVRDKTEVAVFFEGPERRVHVPLRPCEAALLACLLDHLGEPVPRATLQREVRTWRNKRLAPSTVSQAVFRLNRALNEHRDGETNLVRSLTPDDEVFVRLDCEPEELRPDRAPVVRVADDLSPLDQTGRDHHFKILTHEDIHVRDIYVEPSFDVIDVDTNASDSSATSGLGFLDTAQKFLDRDRVLFVVGPYGCGKTLLAKRLQFALQQSGEATAYVSCSDVLHWSSADLEAAVRARARAAERLSLIFDDFDAVVRVQDARDSELEFLKKLLLLHNAHSLIRIVLISRALPDDADATRMHMTSLFGNTCIEVGIERFAVLDVHYFDGQRVKDWLIAFSRERDKQTPKQITTLERAEIPKNLRKACENPLLLYMLALKLIDRKPVHELTDHYDLYEAFVERTARGKFSLNLQVRRWAAQIGPFREEYRSFLCDLAMAIDRGAKSAQTEPSVPRAEVEDLIERFVGRVAPSRHQQLDRKRLFTTLMSCYFLEQLDRRWRFRDENIFRFLLAEYVWVQVSKAVREWNRVGTADLAPFQDAAHVRMTPATVDLLATRIASFPETASKLAEVLAHLVRGKLILSRERGDQQRIRLDTLAFILLVQLNRVAYHTLPGLEQCFVSLLESCEISERVCFDALRRSFRGARVRQWAFRGATLSGFDFRGTTFDQVRIDACRGSELQFTNMAADCVHIAASTFTDVMFDDVHGRIELEDCDISLLRIIESCSVQCSLTHCNVREVRIEGRRGSEASQGVRLEAAACTITLFRVSGVTATAGKAHRLHAPGSAIGHVTLQSAELVVEGPLKSNFQVSQDSALRHVELGCIVPSRTARGWVFDYRADDSRSLLRGGPYGTQNELKAALSSLQSRLHLIRSQEDGGYFFELRSRDTTIAASSLYDDQKTMNQDIEFVEANVASAHVEWDSALVST